MVLRRCRSWVASSALARTNIMNTAARGVTSQSGCANSSSTLIRSLTVASAMSMAATSMSSLSASRSSSCVQPCNALSLRKKTHSRAPPPYHSEQRMCFLIEITTTVEKVPQSRSSGQRVFFFSMQRVLYKGKS